MNLAWPRNRRELNPLADPDPGDRSGAKRIATRHKLGILRNRQPATDEYPVVGHVYDFALCGNASNAIRDEKTSPLHLEPPKQEKRSVSSLPRCPRTARRTSWRRMVTFRRGAKRIATRHELGILRHRQPASDEYPVVGYFDDFAFRGKCRMWTPPGGQARRQNRVGGSLVRYCRMSGLLMQPSSAAGPYGVREIGSKSGMRARRPSAIFWFFRPRLVDRLPLPVPASCCPHLPAASLLVASLLSPAAQAAARTR